MLSVVGFVIHLLLLLSAQSNTQNLTIHGLCFLWQLQRYQMAYSEKTWISHWMDIAADHCHWKDQDQIRFHLRRKTRPWSSSIRPTHLILVTDNSLNLSSDFLTAPWSRCVWFWITGILLLQSTSTSAFIKPELWLNTCGLEPKHLYLIVILLLRFVGQFSYISVQRRYHISWVSPTYPPAHNSAKITSRSQRHARPD